MQYVTALHERVNFGVVVCGPHGVLMESDTRRVALIDPNAAETALAFAEDIRAMNHRLSDVVMFRTWIDEWRLRLLGACQITKASGSLMPADYTLLRICSEALCHQIYGTR